MVILAQDTQKHQTSTLSLPSGQRSRAFRTQERTLTSRLDEDLEPKHCVHFPSLRNINPNTHQSRHRANPLCRPPSILKRLAH